MESDKDIVILSSRDFTLKRLVPGDLNTGGDDEAKAYMRQLHG